MLLHRRAVLAETAAFVAGGLILLALAVRVESRAKEPIIPLGIFRNRTVSLTVIASVLVGVAMFGGTAFLSRYFQVALGKSPTVAGLMSLPMIFGLLVSSTVAGALIRKFGRWKIYLVAGAIVMTVGMLMQNLVLAAQNDVPAADLFLVGAPIAALAVIAVLLIKEKPLSTLSGDERRVQEEADVRRPAGRT